MATTDFTPRFFKVFISQYSSDSLLLPIAYYDQLPRLLSKTAILKGPGGRSWNVAMKIEQEEVYFEQGWARFAEENTLSDGDFLTFVYDGDRTFEVSIYDHNGDKDTRAVTEVEEDKEDSVCSLTSEQEDIEVEEDKEDSVCSLTSEDIDTRSKSETANAIRETRDKGKSKVEVVEDSDDKEDSVYSRNSEDTETETDTCSEFKVAKTIPKRRNKGKKKKKVVESSDEDSDSDYTEAFGRLDVENSNSDDSSYAPDNEDTCVKPKLATNLKKQEAAKKRKKVEPKIKNPERYLDDPKNIYFETNVKNRLYELLVHAQLVKDYCLRFGDYVDYIDGEGTLRAKTAKWKDQRVCIKKWKRICKRNALKKEDRVLCELLRKRDFVYAIKLHIIRGRDL